MSSLVCLIIRKKKNSYKHRLRKRKKRYAHLRKKRARERI